MAIGCCHHGFSHAPVSPTVAGNSTVIPGWLVAASAPPFGGKTSHSSCVGATTRSGLQPAPLLVSTLPVPGPLAIFDGPLMKRVGVTPTGGGVHGRVAGPYASPNSSNLQHIALARRSRQSAAVEYSTHLSTHSLVVSNVSPNDLHVVVGCTGAMA